MKPIALFYHCLFLLGEPPKLLKHACEVVDEQMGELLRSGLLDAASEFHVGINGGAESAWPARILLPKKAQCTFHGLQSRSENLTLVEIEKWVPAHPNWYVLYFHAKGSTHVPDSDYDKFSAQWRKSLMADVVSNWRTCIADLDSGYESAGSHFMRGLADGTQNIWAGNFWWATSDFLATVPSIYLRDRIKVSGIAALESRYESEVWIGNAPRLPKTKEYRPNGGGGCP